MGAYILLFSLVIPVTAIFFIFYLFRFISLQNTKKLVISQLSFSDSDILDEKKVEDEKEEMGFFEKKMYFAGFTFRYAQEFFFFISFMVSFILTAILSTLIKEPFISFFLFFIFLTIPYFVVLFIIKLRLEEFNSNLKDIIDKVTGMMRTGVGFEECLKRSVYQCKSKLTKSIFNIYLYEKDILGEEKSFERMFCLVDSKELRLFYLTVMIGTKSGGKLSSTLDKLRFSLENQNEIKNEITSSTREIKIGTYVIIAMLVFMFFMIDNVLKGALQDHFFGTSTGKIQLFLICLWVALGIFINSMLTRIK